MYKPNGPFPRPTTRDQALNYFGAWSPHSSTRNACSLTGESPDSNQDTEGLVYATDWNLWLSIVIARVQEPGVTSQSAFLGKCIVD